MTRHIDVKETAQIIRGTLKEAFPGVKFSTRLSRYSGGCSIDVSWTDGPVRSQVDPILDRFNGKGFDGMTDCSYYCGRRTWKGERVDFHSGYVRGSRTESAKLTRAIAAKVAAETGIPVPVIEENEGYVHFRDKDRMVPYCWHAHWLEYDAAMDSRKPLTGLDILSPKRLLASNSHGDSSLHCLIMDIARWVTLKPHQQPVELPEYLPEEKGDAA